MVNRQILIASAVNKHERILAEFLRSLEMLDIDGCDVSYCFVDDNDDPAASLLLHGFVERNPGACLLHIEGLYKNMGWERNDHTWSVKKTDKIAQIKNELLEYCLNGPWSHIFIVDADIVLHPETLQNLLSSDKDIVSCIFWTKWKDASQSMPQVWQKDFYTLYDDHMTRTLTPEQKRTETSAFLDKLRVPGVYRVGGLGACTLINRRVLEAGVNYSPLYNISFWREERSFCIRAVAHGFELFVNTVYPAFHIYRMEDLERLPQWAISDDPEFVAKKQCR